MQVKLLRVIQEKEVLRVGGTESVMVDVRFIGATNRDIHDTVKTGRQTRPLFPPERGVAAHPSTFGEEG